MESVSFPILVSKGLVEWKYRTRCNGYYTTNTDLVTLCIRWEFCHTSSGKHCRVDRQDQKLTREKWRRKDRRIKSKESRSAGENSNNSSLHYLSVARTICKNKRSLV